MALTSGRYLIKNRDNYVGRALREDMSLLPKAVLLLPEGVEAPVWEVEVLEDGLVILKTRNSTAARQADRVVAILMEEIPAQQWKLTNDERSGPYAYIVELPHEGIGWVAPKEPEEQLLCRPLVVKESLPPVYPSNEVFEFIPYVEY
ncbi:hypothetical protein AX16_009477 [Volvariella volvacea WC 439]|nr:hypothetical protein AX16_009477 [Volvariella volvacea WC 439]